MFLNKMKRREDMKKRKRRGNEREERNIPSTSIPLLSNSLPSKCLL